MVRKLTNKWRIQLEKIFFSCILSADPFTDWQPIVKKYGSVSWRHFEGNKHRVLWRVLESFDLGTIFSRKEIVLKEKYEELKTSVRETVRAGGVEENEEYIRDLVYAWEAQYELEIARLSSARVWLERELEKTGSFFLVGDRAYLQELYAVYPVPHAADFFAGCLGFVKVDEKELRPLCWNCALAHGAPPYMKCELWNKKVGAHEGDGCEYWQQPRKLYEKLTNEITGEGEWY